MFASRQRAEVERLSEEKLDSAGGLQDVPQRTRVEDLLHLLLKREKTKVLLPWAKDQTKVEFECGNLPRIDR